MAGLKKGAEGHFLWDDAGQVYAPDGKLIWQCALSHPINDRSVLAMKLAHLLDVDAGIEPSVSRIEQAGPAGQGSVDDSFALMQDGMTAKPAAPKPHARSSPDMRAALQATIDWEERCNPAGYGGLPDDIRAKIKAALADAPADPKPDLLSIEAEARRWIGEKWDGPGHTAFHFADMVLAFASGSALALGPLARRLIERTWHECRGAHTIPIPAIVDTILGEIIGEFGPVLAWPVAGDNVPTLGQVSELVIWIVADAAATESAWRKGGVADQKPEEFEFMLEGLNRHRQAADMLRRLAQEVLRMQRERFEFVEIVRCAVDQIRKTAGPDSSARMRERAGLLLEEIGIVKAPGLEPIRPKGR